MPEHVVCGGGGRDEGEGGMELANLSSAHVQYVWGEDSGGEHIS